MLYINDLPLNIHAANLVMCADDISVLITDSDMCTLKKTDRMIIELENWFNRNNLIINVGKSGIMSFHDRRSKFPIKPKSA